MNSLQINLSVKQKLIDICSVYPALQKCMRIVPMFFPMHYFNRSHIQPYNLLFCMALLLYQNNTAIPFLYIFPRVRNLTCYLVVAGPHKIVQFNIYMCTCKIIFLRINKVFSKKSRNLQLRVGSFDVIAYLPACNVIEMTLIFFSKFCKGSKPLL